MNLLQVKRNEVQETSVGLGLAGLKNVYWVARQRDRPLPGSLRRAWILLLTSPPYLCLPCLTPPTSHYPRVQKLKQWKNCSAPGPAWPFTLIL